MRAYENNSWRVLKLFSVYFNRLFRKAYLKTACSIYMKTIRIYFILYVVIEIVYT